MLGGLKLLTVVIVKQPSTTRQNTTIPEHEQIDAGIAAGESVLIESILPIFVWPGKSEVTP